MSFGVDLTIVYQLPQMPQINKGASTRKVEWNRPEGPTTTFNVCHAALCAWVTLSCACITGEEYLTNAAGEQLPDSGDAGDPAAAAEPVGLSEEYPSEAREALDDAGLEGADLRSVP